MGRIESRLQESGVEDMDRIFEEETMRHIRKPPQKVRIAWFEREERTYQIDKEPLIAIHKNHRLYLNAGIMRAMDAPDSVRVGLDKATKIVAIQPYEGDEALITSKRDGADSAHINCKQLVQSLEALGMRRKEHYAVEETQMGEDTVWVARL